MSVYRRYSMKKFIAFILILLLLLGGAAGYVYLNYNVDNILSGNTEENPITYQWEIRDSYAMILGIGDITDANVTIPAQVYLSMADGRYIEDPLQGTLYPVMVAGNAFADCDTIETVTFSEGVTIEGNAMHLGDTGMFSGCDALIAVYDIPHSVTSMNNTFVNCKALTHVNRLPDSLVTMQKCFHKCSALTESPAIPSGVADMTSAYLFCTSLTASPEIPASVTAITGCFEYCTTLTEVGPILASATDFSLTFSGCRSLQSAPVLPDTVENLTKCFLNCSSMTEVSSLPASAINLTAAFNECKSLKTFSVDIPAGVRKMDYAFKDCIGLEEFSSKLPEKLETMDYGFQNCTALKRFVSELPAKLISADDAFHSCSALEEFSVISKQTAKMNDRLFVNCKSLKSVQFDCCPNVEVSNLFAAPYYPEVINLREHTHYDACSSCGQIDILNETVEIDGLTVHFVDVRANVYPFAIKKLQEVIPQALKDGNESLSFVDYRQWVTHIKNQAQKLGAGYNKRWESAGGLNITRNSIPYASVKVGENGWTTSDTATLAHELAHGFDWAANNPLHVKISQSPEWKEIHKAEEDIIYKEFYDHTWYLSMSEYDQMEETFAMANEAYFAHRTWLKAHCPLAYAYMDALWGTTE